MAINLQSTNSVVNDGIKMLVYVCFQFRITTFHSLRLRTWKRFGKPTLG